MTTVNAPVPTYALAKRQPAATDPKVWTRLGVHITDLHNEAQGLRRPERLTRAALGAVTLLRSLGVRIELPSGELPTRDLPSALSRPKPSGTLTLTDREREVLGGMAEGKSNAEIGRELFVTEDTIKTHARRLFRKLDARDRAHAVSQGFRLELLT
ncbi:transcriptional regulator, LuxR family [Stackebrandtia nassauensis DSM 44728]|uniref:Transcriptional regulator, LuxR family n=1 Tax=Stackebrandtia nassauensis (strain DSM 44728 / CIP 108903 / NRRL B-16338 / NBRC 102104 / LLR-40K-21) TaxID=446470 RepID=D3PVS3_STANL|nr:helix-turn-helix transcriptional regulator [Stackebrandtia nassauensis]ADD45044.1 transcriptional regulator, LuxR family [Stackebrandtia nassauensis DSM 44728]